MVSAQRPNLVEWQRSDIDCAELREGRPRLVERGVQRRVRKRPRQREHHSLGTSALGEVVMNDRNVVAVSHDAIRVDALPPSRAGGRLRDFDENALNERRRFQIG